MGDTGSLVCGFILAILAIQLVEMRTVEAAPSLAIAILFIPILDTIRVFGYRILKGISPFTPDKNHIHHILLRNNISNIKAVSLLFFINLLIIAGVILNLDLGNLILLLIIASSFSLLILLFYIKSKVD